MEKLGRIGTRVAGLCSSFGATVIAHDPVVGETSSDIEWVELQDLFARSDIVSLHMPYNEATHHLINEKRLSAMKPGAILINTARGSLVDEAALVTALRDGAIAGAGLDVFEMEPYSGALTEMSQLVLTPHLASSAIESRREMECEAASNLYLGLCKAGVIKNGD